MRPRLLCAAAVVACVAASDITDDAKRAARDADAPAGNFASHACTNAARIDSHRGDAARQARRICQDASAERDAGVTGRDAAATRGRDAAATGTFRPAPPAGHGPHNPRTQKLNKLCEAFAIHWDFAARRADVIARAARVLSADGSADG